MFIVCQNTAHSQSDQCLCYLLNVKLFHAKNQYNSRKSLELSKLILVLPCQTLKTGFLISRLEYFLHFSVEAQKLEKISLQHLQDLIHRIEEVVGLLKITVEHQFHMLSATLTQVHKVFKTYVLYEDFFSHTTAH